MSHLPMPRPVPRLPMAAAATLVCLTMLHGIVGLAAPGRDQLASASATRQATSAAVQRAPSGDSRLALRPATRQTAPSRARPA